MANLQDFFFDAQHDSDSEAAYLGSLGRSLGLSLGLDFLSFLFLALRIGTLALIACAFALALLRPTCRGGSCVRRNGKSERAA
jgi:hypothetical protein